MYLPDRMSGFMLSLAFFFCVQDEFLALMSKKTKEAEDERELREVFRVFDKNSRGVIDVREFKKKYYY